MHDIVLHSTRAIRWPSADHQSTVGVGILAHRVGRQWLLVGDVLLTATDGRKSAGSGTGRSVGHLEGLLSLWHMAPRADGR